jgi:LmbE family N-acetylglucosaminyl deacetylase
VRDATRLARYGGLAELESQPAHAVGQLFFYALGAGAEPVGTPPVLIDISAPNIVAAWTKAMEAHASQMKTRNYIELQLARACGHGLNAGVAYAQPLWPNDPLVFDSIASLNKGARKF